MKKEGDRDRNEGTAETPLSSLSSFILHPSSFREEWQLETRRLGRRVLVFDRLDSTNTLAARLAAGGAGEGLAVLADEQTAGRGQHGRTWQAAPGDGVLLSLLLFPPPELRRPAVLTAWAAVGVCGVVRAVTGLRAQIKWSNDVLVQGRKVCGILIEQTVRERGRPARLGQDAAGTAALPGASGLATVAGIGLNVRQSAEAFAAAALPEATSLAQFAASPPDTHEVARMLIRRLDEEYDRLCQDNLSCLEESWVAHLDLLGRQVIAECQDGTHVAGRLRALSFEGAELERPGLSPLVLRPERVQHLRPAAGGP